MKTLKVARVALVSDLRAICKVAFYESKQDLEKLGFVSQSAPKRKKAESAPAAKG